MSLATQSEFSAKDVARLLSTKDFNVSTRSVLRAIQRGELRAWRQNARVLRITRADLESYIQSRYSDSAAPPAKPSLDRREVTQVAPSGTRVPNSTLIDFVSARRIVAS